MPIAVSPWMRVIYTWGSNIWNLLAWWSSHIAASPRDYKMEMVDFPYGSSWPVEIFSLRAPPPLPLPLGYVQYLLAYTATSTPVCAKLVLSFRAGLASGMHACGNALMIQQVTTLTESNTFAEYPRIWFSIWTGLTIFTIHIHIYLIYAEYLQSSHTIPL